MELSTKSCVHNVFPCIYIFLYFIGIGKILEPIQYIGCQTPYAGAGSHFPWHLQNIDQAYGSDSDRYLSKKIGHHTKHMENESGGTMIKKTKSWKHMISHFITRKKKKNSHFINAVKSQLIVGTCPLVAR